MTSPSPRRSDERYIRSPPEPPPEYDVHDVEPHDREESFPLAEWRSDESETANDISSDDEKAWSPKLFTGEEESRVVRKLDRRLVLFVALLYLLSFLDRSNIGNARAAGLEADLHLTETQFHWILDGFYVTYILFEFMTICYRIFPAHVYISVCVCAMGAIAALQSITTGFWTMLMLRLCLGIAEAAFGPGIPFYLSFFFKRDELARRTGIFIAAAPLANSFAGSLAWLILRFARGSSIDGWRLLFIAEGFPNIIFAVLAWYTVPDSPATASWLTRRERKVATMRLRRTSESHTRSSHFDETKHQDTARKGLDWRAILKTTKDPKSYMVAFILFSLNVAFSSLPVFLPTIVENMGYSALAAQGMSAFPNLSAFAIVLVTAHISDRTKTRSTPLMFHALMAMGGYALLAFAPGMPHAVRYLCLFPITAGFFSAVTMVIVWTINNQESDEGKAVGSSILQVFGHIGSLLGQQLYPDAEAPYYVKSHAVCAFFMAAAAALAFLLRLVLRRANSRRVMASESFREVDRDTEDLVHGSMKESTGDHFQYML